MMTDPAAAVRVGHGFHRRPSGPAPTDMVIGAVLLCGAAAVATLRQQAWEYPLMRAVNSLAGHSLLLDRLMHALTARDLLQGTVFVTLLCFLWFETTEHGVRARLMTGILASACAGVVSRLVQLGLPTHLRPLHTPALAFVYPAGVEPDALNHFASFPSDHGAVFFALAIVIWRERPWMGVASLAWATIIDVARIYEGYHFPSDILGAIGLGLLVVSCSQNAWLDGLARRALVLEQAYRPWFYAFGFLFLFQVATLFDDVREIGRGLARVLLHHDPFAGG